MNGLNFNDLNKLAKANPKYTQLFSGLAQIDNTIKKYAQDIVCNQADESVYYIKTELMGQCYNMYLFNSERRAIVGVSWPLVDFLKKCEDKTIEYDVAKKVIQMIDKFDSKNLYTDNVNWIY